VHDGIRCVIRDIPVGVQLQLRESQSVVEHQLISVQYCLQVSSLSAETVATGPDCAGMSLTNFTERAWRRLNSQPDMAAGLSANSFIILASSTATERHKSVLTTYCLQLTAMCGRRFEQLEAYLLGGTDTHKRVTDMKYIGDPDERNSHATCVEQIKIFLSV